MIMGSIPLLLQHHQQLLHLCKDLGIVINGREARPRANQQGSTSQNVDRHHLRKGLPDGLLDCQISRISRQVSSGSSCKDVTAASRPHGLPEMVCSEGLGQNAPPAVVTEVVLFSSFEKSSEAGSSCRGVQREHRVVTSGGEMGIGNPLQGFSLGMRRSFTQVFYS